VVRWLRAVAVLALTGMVAGGLALAEAPANPNLWPGVKSPAGGAPRSIGDYSAGCVRGAAALSLDGEGYAVVHPERRRYYGHPELLDFVRKLGHKVRATGLGVMLVGDLGQPRGGRAPNGHASHQTGLDVDVWFWSPPQTPHVLSESEREHAKARSVLDARTHSIAERWSPRVTQLLRLTADDPRVARVFVNPIIKRALCEQTKTERAWLSKLRPWYGHDDHFHVRLACPADSPECTPQAPPPPGDGCAELDWWFSDAAQHDREQGKKLYQSKVARTPQLPPQCEALLHEAAAP
jgi:penicillin-insensitive murein endopeptidase